MTAKNGVDYKFSLHFLPGLWYTCLRNKCHAISTICLQLRESVGYRYRRCVLCSYLEEALTHTVTHTTKRMDGNSGEDRAYLPQYTEWKASKSLKKQQAECPDTLRNQQVRCSSHPTNSKKEEDLHCKSASFLERLRFAVQIAACGGAYLKAEKTRQRVSLQSPLWCRQDLCAKLFAGSG